MAEHANITTLSPKTREQDKQQFLAAIGKLSGTECAAIAFLINKVAKDGAL